MMASRNNIDQQKAMASNDPVENFFRRLPPPGPETWSHLTPETDAIVNQACKLLVKEAAAQTCADPDLDTIMRHIVLKKLKGLSATYLYNQLAALGFDKGATADTSDTSHKARHLRFLCWMAEGHRAETAPVYGVLGITRASLPTNPVNNKCAECGQPNAATKCSGCLIRHDDSITFATAYCSKECQRANWKVHKASCRAIQQFQRAASIFQEIFEHSFSTAIPDGSVEKITVQNGMLTMTMNPARHMPNGADAVERPKLSPFPHHLAPTPEAAMSAMMNGKSRVVLSHWRPLFEMLIRRK
jgi:hypothetical protein